MKFLRPVLNLTAFAVLAIVSSATPGPVQAQSSAASQGLGGFQGYLQQVAAKARAQGISENAIGRTLTGLTVNPRVIALDTGQPGLSVSPPPLAPYIRTHVDAARIRGGRAKLAQVRGMLPRIEREYGVPGQMLLAIWGHETNYGSYTGDFDLARSLATLAYEGRRRDLFERELIALIRMVDQGVPQYRLKGSWAGAFGNSQFLPSVWLNTAVDEDGDGNRDIWSSQADTIASIANYFRKAGWRPGEPWGVSASVPQGFGVASYASRLRAPSCGRVLERHSVWKPVSEWRQLGIRPLATIGDGTMASLFQPDGPGTGAYLLTGNYRVILQYNCSNYYAMSVGLLADEIIR
ncbi:MAG TPA: lytic murein transglycosylase [Novosphingobium sp.]|nr:lytic murein transglycosylase [Novosphingobium sp.]